MGACLQAKGRQSRPAGYQRPGFSDVRCSVSETRGNGEAFRDRSSLPWALSFGHPWPNRSLQAPPLPRSLGSVTATGYNTPGPSREGSLESPKERRDRVGPSRTVFGQGWPKRSAARPSLQGCTRGVSWTGPPDPGAGFLERRAFWRERSLESCRQAPLAFRGLGPLLPDPLPLNEKTRHFGGLFGGAWRGEISSIRRAPRTAWRPWRRRRPRR